jgi:hypothetical protein
VPAADERVVPLDAGKRSEEPWLTCAATFPALGVHGALPELIAYLRFWLGGAGEEASLQIVGLAERQRLCTLPIGGGYNPGGFDVVQPDWVEGSTAMKCEGHVSGFSSGVWIAPEVGYAFYIVVNVDGPVGRAARAEVYRLVVDVSYAED